MMARKIRPLFASTVVLLLLCTILISIPYIQSIDDSYAAYDVQGQKSSVSSTSPSLPNVLVFIVDDLGWNQVGYHANKVGNDEIQTPNIDQAVAEGIELNRGYVTPWCVSVVLSLQFKKRTSNLFLLHQPYLIK
jgi:hypothetical protein